MEHQWAFIPKNNGNSLGLSWMWLGVKKTLKCGNQVQVWLKELKTMSDSGENYECFYICFSFWHFKIILIIPSCAKWLIWMLRNSNSNFIKLNFGF